MRQRGLQALTSRRYRPVTSDGKALSPSPNLLKDKTAPTSPNQAWVGDITYLNAALGWVYLALVIDLYSRKVIGWEVADHMRSGLVTGALKQALYSRGRSKAKLIFHSDRGSQYGSASFRALLRAKQITQSMSAKANPYDNAYCESLIGTLKQEMNLKRPFASIREAKSQLFEYIEAYYNTKRKHSALNYKSPFQFEKLTQNIIIS